MRLPISFRRRKCQKGLEAIEFGLLFVFLLPPFVWMFQNGMNFLRFNKATDVSRSAALLFIKGIDFALPGNQSIIARVASGLDLQGSSTASASATSPGQFRESHSPQDSGGSSSASWKSDSANCHCCPVMHSPAR